MKYKLKKYMKAPTHYIRYLKHIISNTPKSELAIITDTSLIAEYEVVDCNFMSVLQSYHRLGFPLFLIPYQKTDILSFLKKSFLPFLLTVPVFNEMCIAAST